jgi:hypothetical protein
MVQEVNFQTHILYLNIFLRDITYTTISKMNRKIGGGTHAYRDAQLGQSPMTELLMALN